MKPRKRPGSGLTPNSNTAMRIMSNSHSDQSDGSHIKVCVRVRPQNERENTSGCNNIIRVMDEHLLVFDPKEENSPGFFHGKRRKGRDFMKKANKDMRFAFDRVFDSDVGNEQVYEETTKGILNGLLDGYNCSVFAYGATGAGKTFTMLGSPTSPGVIFRTMMDLYEHIQQQKDVKTIDVAVSYLEVYNEQIRDLLVPSGYLPIREDPERGGVVTGLSLHKPDSAEELMHMLDFGNRNRTQHPTDANAESSRSHAVFQVFVRQRDRTANLSADVRVAKMSLIDLAGSERATVTTNRGARFREGANINRSLLALGNCINALAEGKKSGFIPYRNSKLTRLLKDSLGGNCRTVMIAAVSPSSLTYEDTYNTLRYANRAKDIKATLKRNVISVDFHISQYAKIVDELRAEVSELKIKLTKYEDGTLVSTQIRNTACNQELEMEHLQGRLGQVFADRINIRKELMELESGERIRNFRMHIKQTHIQRLEMLPANPVVQKAQEQMERYIEVNRKRQENVTKRKESVEERMEQNVADFHKVESNMTRTGSDGNMPEVLQKALRTRHLEVELRDTRRYCKYLRCLSRHQDRECSANERLIMKLLHIARKQFYLLKYSNLVSEDMEKEYDSVISLVTGPEREVAWADRSMGDRSLTETSMSEQSTSGSKTSTPPTNHESSSIGNLLQFPVLSCTPITPHVVRTKTPMRPQHSKGTGIPTPRKTPLFRLNHTPGRTPNKTTTPSTEPAQSKNVPQCQTTPALKTPSHESDCIDKCLTLNAGRTPCCNGIRHPSPEFCDSRSGITPSHVSCTDCGQTSMSDVSTSTNTSTHNQQHLPNHNKSKTLGRHNLDETFVLDCGVFPLQPSPTDNQSAVPVVCSDKTLGSSPVFLAKQERTLNSDTRTTSLEKSDLVVNCATVTKDSNSGGNLSGINKNTVTKSVSSSGNSSQVQHTAVKRSMDFTDVASPAPRPPVAHLSFAEVLKSPSPRSPLMSRENLPPHIPNNSKLNSDQKVQGRLVMRPKTGIPNQSKLAGQRKEIQFTEASEHAFNDQKSTTLPRRHTTLAFSKPSKTDLLHRMGLPSVVEGSRGRPHTENNGDRPGYMQMTKAWKRRHRRSTSEKQNIPNRKFGRVAATNDENAKPSRNWTLGRSKSNVQEFSYKRNLSST